MRDVGYKTAMVPCGGSSEHRDKYLDELSNIGITHIAELKADGSILEYEITPDEVGLEEAPYAGIASTGSQAENARRVARVLAAKEKGPILDVLTLNAAACLKLMGKVPDLASGVEKAREAVLDGRAIAQLRALIETQNQDPGPGLAKLSALLAD
jgi:anthranilate phosphoribosyltransferase